MVQIQVTDSPEVPPDRMVTATELQFLGVELRQGGSDVGPAPAAMMIIGMFTHARMHARTHTHTSNSFVLHSREGMV